MSTGEIRIRSNEFLQLRDICALYQRNVKGLVNEVLTNTKIKNVFLNWATKNQDSLNQSAFFSFLFEACQKEQFKACQIEQPTSSTIKIDGILFRVMPKEDDENTAISLDLFEYLFPASKTLKSEDAITLMNEGQNCGFTLKNLAIFLSDHGKSITCLNLMHYHTFITDEMCQRLLAPCSNVSKLFIRVTKPSDDTFIMLANFPHLTSLTLSWMYRLPTMGLKALANLSNLTTLNLDGCYEMTEEDLSAIATFSNLITLSITDCQNVEEKGLIDIAKLPNLRTLNLNGCRYLKVRAIATFSNLISLDLTLCDDLTDEDLRAVLESNLNLTTLNLAGCYKITDEVLIDIAKLPNLKTLNLGYCYGITDKGLKALAKLSTLIELDLKHCKYFAVEGLKAIIKLPNLEKLDLRGCRRLGQKELEFIHENNPNLKVSY